MRYFQKPIKKEKIIFKIFIENTSLHGLKYIFEKDRHWTERKVTQHFILGIRCFWIICVTISWLASLILIKSAYNTFQNNAISFVVETAYLEWDTEFPSIAVCETDNQDKIAQVSDRIYGDPHDYNLDEIVRESAFFKGLYFYTIEICGSDDDDGDIDPNCFKKTLSELASEVNISCPEIFRSCKWNNIEFDCCQFFDEIQTDFGKCYAINNIQTKTKPRFSMISNRKNGPGSLRLELNGYASVYMLLGEQEVPSLLTSTTNILEIQPNMYLKRHFAMKDIENQPEVEYLEILQRKCRFPNENYLKVLPFYGYSGCLIECRKQAQIEKCGCAHHLVPNTPSEKKCNISGIKCLNKHYQEVSVLKPAWSDRVGLVCDCLPSCNEIQLSVIRDFKEGIPEDFAIVELTLDRLPTERYKRNVVRGKLDLVVSMGNAVALFMGASVASFVEIIYFFVIRTLTTYFRNKKQDRKTFRDVNFKNY